MAAEAVAVATAVAVTPCMRSMSTTGSTAALTTPASPAGAGACVGASSFRGPASCAAWRAAVDSVPKLPSAGVTPDRCKVVADESHPKGLGMLSERTVRQW